MRNASSLIIDLERLEENTLKLKKLCPGNEVVAMVKANAYGHGLLPIVDFFYHELSIRSFGLATIGEAKVLREYFPMANFDLYVFSELDLFGEMDFYLNKRIIPVLSNIDDLDFFLEKSDFSHAPLCLKFNTGMNRLGIELDMVDQVCSKIKKAGRGSIFHLMSHFANASRSMDDDPQNILQIKNFAHLKSILKSKGIQVENSSVANSGCIEQGHMLNESHVRPGLMLYGPSSLDESIAHLGCYRGEMISKLECEVLAVREVKKGDPIGYEGVICPREGRMAIASLGYGDGLPTRFQNKEVLHQNSSGQVIGKVNMDMAQVLFSPKHKIKKGDSLEFWGDDPVYFNQLCSKMGMIPYEVFCQLTSRLPRVYRKRS